MSGMWLPTSSVVISLFLVVIFFLKENFDNEEVKVYKKLIIGNFFFSLNATAVYIFAKKIGNVLVIGLMQKLHLSLLVLIAFYFCLYLSKINRYKTEKAKSLIEKILFIIFLIGILGTIISPVKVINYEEILDVGGISYYFSISSVILYFILMSILAIKYHLQTEKNINKIVPIISLMMMFAIGLFLRVYFPEVITETFCTTFALLIMYFTIENPDVKMIDALNEAKLSAEKANRAKSDFLSSMSHEIRTPLNAIVGFSDCILEEETLESAKEDAKNIKLASDNLLEIVNGILDISKIEANKMEIVEIEYNPLENLDNVAKLVKPRIGDKPIDLIVKFAPDIPYTLYGDCGKIRQVVTNILTNAVKYTEEGRIILCVNCVNEDGFTKLVISVEDTGRGIKHEQIDKLFTKFQRLDEDKNTTLEGTGLGLAITKRFVEMMGGKIVVQSKYGEGSKFTVYLRQRIVTMNKPEDKETEELINTMQIKLFDFSNSKVLVVDDNKININVALKLLSKYGINADSSESGFGALDKLNSGEKYDLILLDDMMPKMSGVETLKHIREDFKENIPVVALTANALSDMRDKYISAGFDDYLSKPIEKSELYRVLVKYLNNKLEQKKTDEEKELDSDDKVSNKEEQFNKKTILIVDDNKINIKIAEKLLSHFAYIESDSALSGKEAIDKVKEKNYDLIFMDIMMPEMDGVETLHYLRDKLGFENPVVTLTADAVSGAREKYLSEGFDEYLDKPVNVDDMEKILNLFIKKD